MSRPPRRRYHVLTATQRVWRTWTNGSFPDTRSYRAMMTHMWLALHTAPCVSNTTEHVMSAVSSLPAGHALARGQPDMCRRPRFGILGSRQHGHLHLRGFLHARPSLAQLHAARCAGACGGPFFARIHALLSSASFLHAPHLSVSLGRDRRPAPPPTRSTRTDKKLTDAFPMQ